MLVSSRARGFTLIEALLSLVVLSVGLLGAAAMLLDSLRGQAGALRQLGATRLLADMADRVRANPQGRAHYDTDASGSAASCVETDGCDSAQLAAADRAHFAAAARALFPQGAVNVRYEPAIGPAAPDRYVITLRWRDAVGDIGMTLQVLAQSPVAG
jgi:type IV pilus assembly protein PilV